MIPHLNIFERFIAWLLWRYESFEDLDEAEFNLIQHPSLTRTVGLLRAYYYNKSAKES